MANHRFPRSRPEDQAVSSSAIVRFLDRVASERIELHSMMLVRHGQVVAEGWWHPYGPDRVHQLFSLSKSFTATAVGLAQAEGRLPVDAPVLSFFPEEDSAEARANMRGLEVRHLLMMGTGHREDTFPRLAQLGGDNWVHGFFQCPVEYEPGTHFVYNNGATYMLSAIVQRVTGETLLEYLTPRLFDPLGIESPTWEKSPQGINIGASGLKIRTEDIVAFGQLYLENGQWHGQSLVPAAWVKEATRVQISNGSDPASDWAQGYGYQFWRSRHGAFRGDGAFGQFCIILPEQDAVLAMTSGVSNMGAVFEAVWDELLPGFLDNGSVKTTPGDGTILSERLRQLRHDDLPWQSALASERGPNTPRHIQLERGESDSPCTIQLDFPDPDSVRVTLHQPNREILAHCGLNQAVGPQFLPLLLEGAPEPALARALWSDTKTLELALRFIETPFCLRVRLTFDETGVTIERWQNTAPDEIKRWHGTLI
jgi:CubicO group peptidase (beta-lactamase class C family)